MHGDKWALVLQATTEIIFDLSLERRFERQFSKLSNVSKH